MEHADKIREMAQLLFDNADYLAEELTRRKDKYRYFQLSLDAHNATSPDELATSVWMGDEGQSVDHIEGEYVEIETIKRKWLDVNHSLGLMGKPEPIKTRKKL